MAKQPVKRISVSIPAGDERCEEWLKGQSNISSSLRFLIYDALSRWGARDIVYDVMPAAISAISGRKASKQRFDDNLRQQEQPQSSPQPVLAPSPPSKPLTQPQTQVPVPKAEPVPAPADDPDDDSYFIDPAKFL